MSKPVQLGIIRHIDDLGRLVIPKEYRKAIFGSKPWENEPMSMTIEEEPDGEIILKIRHHKTHGCYHWKPNVKLHENDINVSYICSRCNSNSNEATNYCPNCGVKMNNDNIAEETEKQIQLATNDQS